jgi:outer membrane immunogenic protein
MGTYQKKRLSGILGVTLASVAVLAVANAADMYPGPTPTGGVVDWAGFYIGANIGGAWGELNTTDIFGLYGTPVGVFVNDTSGVFGGAQLGYNFQRGNFIIGPEADLGGMGISGAKSNAPGFQDSVASGFYADITGRIGFAVNPALYLYAKGGYAYFSGSISHTDTFIPSTVSASDLSGWTAGGGAEWKFNPSWSVKIEYLHFDFGDNTLYDANGTCTPSACPFKDHFVVDTAKVGINYFVSSIYEPLK